MSRDPDYEIFFGWTIRSEETDLVQMINQHFCMIIIDIFVHIFENFCTYFGVTHANYVYQYCFIIGRSGARSRNKFIGVIFYFVHIFNWKRRRKYFHVATSSILKMKSHGIIFGCCR